MKKGRTVAAVTACHTQEPRPACPAIGLDRTPSFMLYKDKEVPIH